MDKEVVKELIQQEMNEENLVHELGLLLTNKNKQQKLQEDYDRLRALLKLGGNASENAALSVWDFVNK
jgi:lipid-A-disaccharide synthase